MPANIKLIRLSERLDNIFRSHRRISGLLMSLDLNNMSNEDKPVLEELNTSAKRYLKSDVNLLREWENTYERFLNVIEWGSGSDRNLISALLLAGAAIDRPDINLRDDLSPSLIQARVKYQQVIVDQPAPIWTNIVETLQMGTSKSNFVVRLAKSHRLMKDRMKSDGHLNKAIKTLLQDKSKPLRVGSDLKTLDLDKLFEEREKRFAKIPVGYSIITPKTSGVGQKARTINAPTKLELKTINFDCIKRQENPTDEIFWITQFFNVKNLEEIYNQIDDAIINQRLNELKLEIEWERQKWISKLFEDIDETSNNIDLRNKIGLTKIYHGFCPWICNITCIEQDDSEYEAINDVIDTIDEIADTIGYGARTVAALAGPSHVAAAAGAVASAAKIVSFACDVAGAVVDIANFFDENDTIGFVDQQGLFDYAGVTAQTTDPFSLSAGKIRGANYLVRTEYTLTGNEQFNRTWRYEQDTVYGKWKHRDPLGPFGGDGDDVTTLLFGRPVHSLINHGVVCNYEPDVRHAEWKEKPILQDDQLKVKGVVHWGVSWENSIDYRAWVSGLRFLTEV